LSYVVSEKTMMSQPVVITQVYTITSVCDFYALWPEPHRRDYNIDLPTLQNHHLVYISMGNDLL
jgi:hypothetical protein